MNILAYLALLIILLFLIGYVYAMSNRNKILFIYNSKNDWMTIVDKSKSLINELYSHDKDIILYDLNTNDPMNIILQMNKLYDKGFRIFIGFASSELLDRCVPFFNAHMDTICVSISSTIDKKFPKNILRSSFSDKYYLNALKKSKQLDKYKKIIIIEEKNNDWSEKFSKDIKTVLGTQYIYEHYFVDLRDKNKTRETINGIVAKIDDTTIIAPIISIGVESFIEIFNNLETNKIINAFCGDGLFGFDVKTDKSIQFSKKINLTVPIFYGNYSKYIDIYNNPFVINIIDIVDVMRRNRYVSDINKIDFSGIGYNGLVDLDENNSRKYGKIVILKFGENVSNWRVQTVYENDKKLGELVSSADMRIF